MLPSTVQFLIMMIACSLSERLQKALDYKSAEVLVLEESSREVTKKRRIDFTEEQRARLALAGKALTAKERREYCEIVKPEDHPGPESASIALESSLVSLSVAWPGDVRPAAQALQLVCVLKECQQ